MESALFSDDAEVRWFSQVPRYAGPRNSKGDGENYKLKKKVLE